jgi:uridylate kinase
MSEKAGGKKHEGGRPHGKLPYKRIVLKLSGEVLGGSSKSILDVNFTREVLGQIKAVADLGVQIGIVVGGGNILRGCQAVKGGLGRVSADSIGMLGTIMNGIALRDIGHSIGLEIHVLSCLPSSSFAEPYAVEEAVAYLEQGKVVVFVGGTGNPYLTTDTAAAIRAAEIRADAILKATKVSGVFSCDPMVDSKATRFETLSFKDAMRLDLGFMDKSSLCLCDEAEIPVVVFNVYEKDSILRVAKGEKIGTTVAGVSHD